MLYEVITGDVAGSDAATLPLEALLAQLPQPHEQDHAHVARNNFV